MTSSILLNSAFSHVHIFTFIYCSSCQPPDKMSVDAFQCLKFTNVDKHLFDTKVLRRNYYTIILKSILIYYASKIDLQWLGRFGCPYMCCTQAMFVDIFISSSPCKCGLLRPPVQYKEGYILIGRRHSKKVY